MWRRVPTALTGLVVCVFALPGLASADTYCVNRNGCDHDDGNPSLATALSHALFHPGDDTVLMGVGYADANAGITYDSPDPVHVVGVGGPGVGTFGTVLEDIAMNPTGQTVLKLKGSSASSISGIEVMVPGGTGADNVGIETDAAVSKVLVVSAASPSTKPVGVTLDAGASMTGSEIQMPAGAASTGISVAGAGASVTDSRVEAVTGIEVPNAGAPSLDARRLTIRSSGIPAFLSRGDVAIADSLLETLDNTSFVPSGPQINTSGAKSTLALDHVTMIGSSGASTALAAIGSNPGDEADIFLRNSVFTGYANTFTRFGANGATANIVTDYSDYGGVPAAISGPGAITETNHLDVPPGFVGPHDYHLAPGSPLIEAANPAPLSASESATDVDGRPRIADGDGDCSARRDIGAFEFAPGPRAPRAAASATPAQAVTDQAVALDASASCDPDGDPLAFSWAFDDGTPAGAGASVQHAFAEPGRHTAVVTVSDAGGRSSVAVATVLVAEPPPLPFAGVTIANQTVKVSRKGVAKVKVGCPAAASGSCAGTLELTAKLRRTAKLGSRRFDIPAGKTGKVPVKLSKARRAMLRRRGRLNALATATAHDASGLTKVGAGTLTLVAPK